MQYFQGVFEAGEVQMVERDPARLPAAGLAQAHREPAHQLHRKVRPTLTLPKLFTSCRIPVLFL
jgi:hypothetical protein